MDKLLKIINEETVAVPLRDEYSNLRFTSLKEVLDRTFLPLDKTKELYVDLKKDISNLTDGYIFYKEFDPVAAIIASKRDTMLIVVLTQRLIKDNFLEIIQCLKESGAEIPIPTESEVGIIFGIEKSLKDIVVNQQWFVILPENKNCYATEKEAVSAAQDMADEYFGKSFKVAKVTNTFKELSAQPVSGPMMLKTVSEHRGVEYSVLDAVEKFHIRGHIEVTDLRLLHIGGNPEWGDVDMLISVDILSTPHRCWKTESIAVRWSGNCIIHRTIDGKLKLTSPTSWQNSLPQDFGEITDECVIDNNVPPNISHRLDIGKWCEEDSKYKFFESVDLTEIASESPEATTLVKVLETLIAKNTIVETFMSSAITHNTGPWFDFTGPEELGYYQIDLETFQEFTWEYLTDTPEDVHSNHPGRGENELLNDIIAIRDHISICRARPWIIVAEDGHYGTNEYFTFIRTNLDSVSKSEGFVAIQWLADLTTLAQSVIETKIPDGIQRGDIVVFHYKDFRKKYIDKVYLKRHTDILEEERERSNDQKTSKQI